MKNILVAFILMLFALNISAQQTDSVLRSKKGIAILPQAGDWAIGADADPFLNFIGNIFNNTSDNELNLGNQVLYGRYFLTDNKAVRLLVGINKGNNASRYFVRDDAAFFQDALSQKQTEDKYSYNYNITSFDLGYQLFRGYGRLRGFYGAHLIYSMNRTQNDYTYGNPISALNNTPTSAFGYTNGARTLSSDNGLDQTIGIGAIGGIEYYFAPKICIGGEISATFYNSWRSEGDSKTEMWNGSSVVELTKENSPAGRTGTRFNTYRNDNFQGKLYLMFHF